MRHVPSEQYIWQRFTNSYRPWANRTIERLDRIMLRLVSAVLLESETSRKQWPSITKAFQKSMNKSPIERLGRDSEVARWCVIHIFIFLKPTGILFRPMPLKIYRNMKSIRKNSIKQSWTLGRYRWLYVRCELRHLEVGMQNASTRRVIKTPDGRVSPEHLPR